MPGFYQRLIGSIFRIRQDNLDWKSINQQAIVTLEKSRTLAKAELNAELKVLNTHLSHEIALLKTRQSADLNRLSIQCKSELDDYKQYLESLEQLKAITKASFDHLPEAVALTIHHHAKSLLNRMWESTNAQEKIRLEAELLRFMTTVSEEAEQCRLSVSPQKSLPQNTLKLIGLTGQPD
jgi:hypothetical protein